MLPSAVEEIQYTHKEFGQVYSQEGPAVPYQALQ